MTVGQAPLDTPPPGIQAAAPDPSCRAPPEHGREAASAQCRSSGHRRPDRVAQRRSRREAECKSPPQDAAATRRGWRGCLPPSRQRMEGERVAVGTLSTYMRANYGIHLLEPQHHITKCMGETYARIPTVFLAKQHVIVESSANQPEVQVRRTVSTGRC